MSKLKTQPPGLRAQKSGIILEKLTGLLELQAGHAVMFYVPLDEEVDTMPLLRRALGKGVSVAVPRVDRISKLLVPVEIHDPKQDLIPGTYGILEPRPNLESSFDVRLLDAVLVPGLAFDRLGNRLGRGRGYYDRFLMALPEGIRRYGLAFDFQMFDSIPTSDSDVRMHQVITNE